MQNPLPFFMFLLTFSIHVAHADTVVSSNQHDFKVTEVVNGLDIPWGLAFLPNGDMLVTERDRAQLRLIKNNTLIDAPITGLPGNLVTGGQGGLLDVAVHPHFEKNGWVYLSYSGRGAGGSSTEVVRAKLDGMTLRNLKVLFVQQPKSSGRNHFGSRLEFAKDGTLFITTGDKYGLLEEAQNPKNHIGTVIRLKDDGAIPEDNPFVGDPEKKPEIFSYGHRNGQGLTMRPMDQVMWMHEHGPRGGDEVNILNKPGANYGWPAITYGIDYSGAIISDQTHAPGMEQPVVHWSPSIAPSGMTFYEGGLFPNWQDDLFIGTLRGSHLRRLELEGNRVVEQEILLKDFARIRDVVNGADGYLYFLTNENDSRVMRLEPVQ